MNGMNAIDPLRADSEAALARAAANAELGLAVRRGKCPPERQREFVNRSRCGYKPLMAKQAATEPPAPTIRLSTNAIFNGRFFNRGEPLPVASVADLPSNLQKVVATESEADEGPNEPSGAFELNTLYQLTSDGRLGRKLQRHAAQMEAENAEEAWVEEQANAPLPPEVAASLQEEHENAVALATAQAAAATRISDEASDAAAAAAEPPRLFVKRGSRHYVEIHRTKLRPSEPVFTKDPVGAYEFIGETDNHGSPPDPPTIIT